MLMPVAYVYLIYICGLRSGWKAWDSELERAFLLLMELVVHGAFSAHACKICASAESKRKKLKGLMSRVSAGVTRIFVSSGLSVEVAEHPNRWQEIHGLFILILSSTWIFVFFRILEQELGNSSTTHASCKICISCISGSNHVPFDVPLSNLESPVVIVQLQRLGVVYYRQIGWWALCGPGKGCQGNFYGCWTWWYSTG